MVFIHITEKGRGFFALNFNDKIIGKIKVRLAGNELILLDTVVLFKRCLHSIGVQLLQSTVEFARMHELKIVTVSKFAQRQFSSDPLRYADVWEKG